MMTKRKTKFRWSYISRKDNKRHLTKKAKAYLSKRQKERIPKIKEIEVTVIHFKAIYKSKRGSSHDFFLEGTIISDMTKSDAELEEYIKDKLNTRNFDTDNEIIKDFIDMIEFNRIEIGTSTETRLVTDEIEWNKLKVDIYGYRI